MHPYFVWTDVAAGRPNVIGLLYGKSAGKMALR